MKFAVFVAAMMAAGAAQAHPGHLAEVAGHGHWLGAAAIGAVAVKQADNRQQARHSSTRHAALAKRGATCLGRAHQPAP